MMRSSRILIVEDEHALSLALAAAVRLVGASTDLASSAAQARKRLVASPGAYDALILDIGLPDENGLRLLENLPDSARLPALIITAHAELGNAIQARKLGVLDFFPKPLDFDKFKEALRRLIASAPGPARTAAAPAAETPAAFIGAAPAMHPVFQQIAHACACDEPVLISGESGTGRSLTATLIRRQSHRISEVQTTFRPPPSGQVEALRSALDDARQGVFILDGISQLKAEAQAELLRSWEAAPDTFPRLLAITGPDLRDQVVSGDFRSELFYRVQVLEVRLPPLRDRIEDVPALFSYFLASQRPDRHLETASAAKSALAAYRWPGNLRELRNVAFYALTVSGGVGPVDWRHLPDYLSGGKVAAIPPGDQFLSDTLDTWLSGFDGLPPYRELTSTLDRLLVERLLARFDGKLARLANALDANRTTLRKKLNP